jgi:hypothetical protein
MTKSSTPRIGPKCINMYALMDIDTLASEIHPRSILNAGL